MDKSSKIWVAAIVVAATAALLLLFQPTIEERLAPEIKTAWVGVEVGDSGVATVGPVEMEAGTPFRLHAVVEAADRQGEPLYYTEAPALRIGGRDVPAERLRRWDRPLEARVRWFTVEGSPPFLEVSSEDDLARFEMKALYRSTWPLAWSVPGVLEPTGDDHLATGAVGRDLGDRSFGTQRYQVVVELYRAIDELIPHTTVRSWGPTDLETRGEGFATVRRLLPGRLGPASRVFGLAQIEVRGGGEALLGRIDELARKGLAFSLATVVRDQVDGAGKRFDALVWRPVDLVAGDLPWGEASAGDLLRVGDRVVVLDADSNGNGRLDGPDICLDFALGPAVRPLREVFSGDGLVELASLD